jgi:flagellar hook protein FlgE
MMDVVGNNIANVNTTGFKTSSVLFEDTLSQQLRAGSQPQLGGNAGTNPSMIGLGVKIGGITTNFGQGAAQLTGRQTDIMIQGDGFFVTKYSGQDLFTRAGAFSLDANGSLSTPDGAILQGWLPDATGTISTSGTPTNLVLPISTLSPPVATTEVGMGGNLPSSTAIGASLVSSVTTYDVNGITHTFTATFTKTAANEWEMKLSESTDGTSTDISTTPLTFNAAGQLTSPNPATISGIAVPSGAGDTPPTEVELDITKLSQFGGQNTLGSTLTQNGAAMGSLQSFNVTADGQILGVFSNGNKQTLGKIAMATFNNPEGLEKVGNSSYAAGVNSGLAQIGEAASASRGTLAGGVLEMSNVDLAAEFTNLIVAQRGFQANSRMITASDEVLQDLVNLKR